MRQVILIIAALILVVTVSLIRNKPQSELTSLKYLQEIYSSDGKIDFSAKKAIWNNKEVPLPSPDIAERLFQNPVKVLGENTSEKWIEINLDTQHLYAHDGQRIVYDFPISSGLPWTPTVTGQFYIWAKVRAQRMTGGNVADGSYYDLPNVQFVQYFYKGYGLHGTYWHNDFGKPRSHGCINLSTPDAEKLFWWTNPALPEGKYSETQIQPEVSTRVVIYGKTPGV